MDGAFNRRFALLHAARAVLRVVPAAVVVLDRELRIRITNGAARRLFPTRRDPGGLAHLRNALPRDFGAAVERMAATAKVRKQRIDTTWPASSVPQYRVTADPAPNHVVIVAHEISPTEGRAAGADAVSWCASILAAAPVGAAVYDSSLQMIDCNEAFATIIGSSRERILDVPIDELRDQRHRACLQQALRGETVVVETPYHTTTSDTWLWVRATFMPLRDVLGQVVRVVLFIEDRSREATALEAERRSRNQLSDAERIGHIASWTWDAVRGVSEISPEFHRMLASDPTKFEPTPSALKQLISVEDRDVVLATIRKILKERRPSAELELRLVRMDGRVRWAKVQSQWIYDPSGRLLSASGVIQDVTEWHLLQEQFRHAQRMEPLGRLAAGVAHDFKNLLTVIQMNAAFAQSSLPPDSLLREELAAIVAAAHRANEVTRQLLAFGRKQVLQPRVVDVNEIVKRVVEMLRHMLGPTVAVDLRLEPALWPVFADPAQLEQVLMNLAVNSRDAMPAGGTITLRTASVAVGGHADRPGLRPGSYVMIRVADTGSGIDPNVLPHIFEPFFTTKQHGDGTGLGLSTVYGIVKQSGGYVYADSPPGAGAHLIILLPRYSETPQTETGDAEGV